MPNPSLACREIVKNAPRATQAQNSLLFFQFADQSTRQILRRNCVRVNDEHFPHLPTANTTLPRLSVVDSREIITIFITQCYPVKIIHHSLYQYQKGNSGSGIEHRDNDGVTSTKARIDRLSGQPRQTLLLNRNPMNALVHRHFEVRVKTSVKTGCRENRY